VYALCKSIPGTHKCQALLKTAQTLSTLVPKNGRLGEQLGRELIPVINNARCQSKQNSENACKEALQNTRTKQTPAAHHASIPWLCVLFGSCRTVSRQIHGNKGALKLLILCLNEGINVPQNRILFRAVLRGAQVR